MPGDFGEFFNLCKSGWRGENIGSLVHKDFSTNLLTCLRYVRLLWVRMHGEIAGNFRFLLVIRSNGSKAILNLSCGLDFCW